MKRCLPLVLLVFAGCKSSVPVYKPLVAPFPPRVQAKALALAVPAPAQTNFYNPHKFFVPVLPEFKLPPGWQTNHWRLMRSTNFVDWQGVCAWTKGRDCAIFLQGERCYLRLETYTPPAPPVHIPDGNINDL